MFELQPTENYTQTRLSILLLVTKKKKLARARTHTLERNKFHLQKITRQKQQQQLHD